MHCVVALQQAAAAAAAALLAAPFKKIHSAAHALLQTGSGKTYSMGTGFEVGLPPEQVGILPRAAQYLFDNCEASRREAEAAVRCS